MEDYAMGRKWKVEERSNALMGMMVNGLFGKGRDGKDQNGKSERGDLETTEDPGSKRG